MTVTWKLSISPKSRNRSLGSVDDVALMSEYPRKMLPSVENGSVDVVGLTVASRRLSMLQVTVPLSTLMTHSRHANAARTGGGGARLLGEGGRLGRGRRAAAEGGVVRVALSASWRPCRQRTPPTRCSAAPR